MRARRQGWRRFATAILAITLALVFGVAGCARTQKPVLYPNAKLKDVGQEQVQRDIEDCRKLASQYVESTAAKDIGKGAAVGGAAGAVHGAVKQAEPSPIYKQFVNRCLHERGYDVLGWQ